MTEFLKKLREATLRAFTYVARGVGEANGVVGLSSSTNTRRNSLEHAYASAALRRAFPFSCDARILGDVKEHL